jgi:hypothetical protein
MTEAVRAAADELGRGAALTYGDYDRFAMGDAQLHDTDRRWPRAATIARRFGSWAHALLAAGLLDDESFNRRAGRVGTQATDEELVAWLRLAARELGTPLSRASYERWRVNRIANGASPAAVPPSDATIRLRLGGWRAAQALLGP